MPQGELEVVGPGERHDATATWTVVVDRRGRPTAVVLRRGAMTAAEDLGAPAHVVAVAGGRTGPIALYEAEMCTVVATTGRIGIVPAGSWLHAVLARQPEAVEHHLAAAVDIVFPAATNGEKLDP